MDPRLEMKLKQYEATVVDYLGKEGGYFLLFSDDTAFSSVVRNTVAKHLAIQTDCMHSVSDPEQVLKVITESLKRRKHLLVFIEHLMNGKNMGFMVRQVKNAFSQVKVVVLVGETEQSRLVLLHEIGADNFITKPISVNALIEKIAFTIKPQSKLGKLIDTGKALVAQGAFENALKVGRQILEIKPGSAAGLLVLGDAYKGLGKNEKAHEAYLAAHESSDLFLDPLKKLAELHREMGDRAEELKYLERLDAISPLNVERKVDMGAIHVDLGNEDKAEDLFQSAVMQAGKEAAVYLEGVSARIGGIYSAKHPDKAEEYYRQALTAKGEFLDKSDIETFNNLGLALRRQGKWKEAVEEYAKALAITPDDENLYYNMAMAQAEGKEYASAYANINKALGLNPDMHRRDAVLCYNLAIVFVKAGYPQQAAPLLDIALKLRPDFDNAKKLLASL